MLVTLFILQRSDWIFELSLPAFHLHSTLRFDSQLATTQSCLSHWVFGQLQHNAHAGQRSDCSAPSAGHVGHFTRLFITRCPAVTWPLHNCCTERWCTDLLDVPPPCTSAHKQKQTQVNCMVWRPFVHQLAMIKLLNLPHATLLHIRYDNNTFLSVVLLLTYKISFCTWLFAKQLTCDSEINISTDLQPCYLKTMSLLLDCKAENGKLITQKCMIDL